jgi:hypothetical protein
MAAAGLSRGLAGEQKLQQTFNLEDGQLAAKKNVPIWRADPVQWYQRALAQPNTLG